MSVGAADTGQLVTESLAFERFGDAILIHPGAVAVSQVALVTAQWTDQRPVAPHGR